MARSSTTLSRTTVYGGGVITRPQQPSRHDYRYGSAPTWAKRVVSRNAENER